MDVLKKQGQIDKRVFAVYLTSRSAKGSMLTIGGTDSSLYTGDLYYVPVITDYFPFWIVSASDIKVGGVSLGVCKDIVNCYMAADTGTNVLIAPPKQAKKLLSKIGKVAEDCSNANTLPTLSINVHGKEFELGPDFYVLRISSNDGESCELGISAVDGGTEMWFLGDPFLRKYYSVWDAEKNRMGFALAKHSAGQLIVV